MSSAKQLQHSRTLPGFDGVGDGLGDGFFGDVRGGLIGPGGGGPGGGGPGGGGPGGGGPGGGGPGGGNPGGGGPGGGNPGGGGPGGGNPGGGGPGGGGPGGGNPGGGGPGGGNPGGGGPGGGGPGGGGPGGGDPGGGDPGGGDPVGGDPGGGDPGGGNADPAGGGPSIGTDPIGIIQFSDPLSSINTGQWGDPFSGLTSGQWGDPFGTITPSSGDPIGITGQFMDPSGGITGQSGDPFGGIGGQVGDPNLDPTGALHQGTDINIVPPTLPVRDYPLPILVGPNAGYQDQTPSPQDQTPYKDWRTIFPIDGTPFQLPQLPGTATGGGSGTTSTPGLLTLQQKLALLQAANAKAATNLMNGAFKTLSSFAKLAGAQDTTYDTLMDAFNAILAILVLLTHTEVENDLNDFNTNTPQGVSDYNAQISAWINSLNTVIHDMKTLKDELNDGTLLPPPSVADVLNVISQAQGWIYYLKSLKIH